MNTNNSSKGYERTKEKKKKRKENRKGVTIFK